MLNCDYDIIVFQELFHKKVRNYFCEKFAKKYPYHYGPVNNRFISFRFNGGVVVFSKCPLKLKKQIIFKARKGIEIFAKKGAMLIEGEWENTKFQIIGTHIQAFSDKEIKYAQMKEILDKLLLPYYMKDVPQIICGDMNINSHTQNEYEGMLAVFGINEGRLIWEKQYSKANGREIDYILICKNENDSIEIKRKVKVFPPDKSCPFVELSDHYAIEAEIQF